MNKLLSLCFALVTAGFCSTAPAADWPNFRGPAHNGISTESGWLAKWPSEGPKTLWKASLGVGYSSVIVAQGRALASGNQSSNATLFCFDAETGKNQWQFSYSSELYSNYNGPKGLGGTSGSPTVEGDRVYLLSGNGCLYALNFQTGGVIWSNDLAATLGAAKPTWGFSSSALVQGNLLVLDIGGCGAAVDKATGKVVWASDEEACGYSTPVPYTNHGAACAAILSAKGAYGVEAASGKLDWSFLFASSVAINIPDVVVSGNEFFVSTAASIGGAAFRVEGTNVAPVWTNSAFGNHVCTSVLVDGCLYGVAGAIINGPGATLRCLDFATGAQKWEDASDPIGGFVVADHKFILLTDRGELVDGEVSPAGFTPISRAQVLAPSCWTSPTLANGRIYCRNNKGDMVCLDVKKP